MSVEQYMCSDSVVPQPVHVLLLARRRPRSRARLSEEGAQPMTFLLFCG